MKRAAAHRDVGRGSRRRAGDDDDESLILPEKRRRSRIESPDAESPLAEEPPTSVKPRGRMVRTSLEQRAKGSCMIYDWEVTDRKTGKLAKFRDPRVKLQAISLFQRYHDVQEDEGIMVTMDEEQMEIVCAAGLLVSSKIFDSSEHVLCASKVKTSLSAACAKTTVGDLDEMELQLLGSLGYEIQRDRLIVLFDSATEILEGIKDTINAGLDDADSLLWNRLVDTVFFIACAPDMRQQLDGVPDPLLSCALVASAYALSNVSETVRLPGSLLYALCCTAPIIEGRWTTNDLQIVSNLILDFVLAAIPDARYSFLDMADNILV